MNRRLYDMLSEAAETRGLTMHAEIIARLEGSFSEQDRAKVDEFMLKMQEIVRGSLLANLGPDIEKALDRAQNDLALPARNIIAHHIIHDWLKSKGYLRDNSDVI